MMDCPQWEYPWPVAEQEEGGLEEVTDSPWNSGFPETETSQQLQTRIIK